MLMITKVDWRIDSMHKEGKSGTNRVSVTKLSLIAQALHFEHVDIGLCQKYVKESTI